MDGFAGVLAAAAAGGEWALARIYAELSPAVARFVRARVRGAADAEDVAADTWVDVARNLGTFAGSEPEFRAWVFTIARRRIADHVRRASRQVPVDQRGQEHLESLPTAGDAEDAAFAGRLGDEAARRIVAALPAEQAEIVLLRVVAGLTVEQVAAIVGRRPGTVRVLQHRALRRLARELGEKSGPEL